MASAVAEQGPPETAAGRRARQIAEAEALLVTSGVELYALVMEQARWQLGQGTAPPGLAGLLAQARASLLRGLRLPERITRQEAPAAGAALAARREGGAFDSAAFAELFLSLARGGGASGGPAGADGDPLALDPPGADDKTGGLPGGPGA